jgi:transcription elongation GreA/GreB family factor
MHHQSLALTTFGVKRLHDKLAIMKERYEHITKDLKDKTQSYSILAIKRIEQEILAADILNMERVLSSANVIEKDIHPCIAEQGTTVVYVQDSTSAQTEVTLVHPLEADPSEGFVSVKSPIGAALLGHNVEDVVLITTPKGINKLTIVRLA